MRTSLVDRRSVERLLLLVGALRSGLIDALAGEDAVTLDQVARSAGTDPRASRVILGALDSEGIVEEKAGPEGDVLYRLSPLGRAHLVDEGPDLERSGLVHQVNKLRGWLDLPEVIRTGRPASSGMARRDVRSRAMAMGERDPAVLAEIVERCLAYAGTIRSMVDIGGSVGHLAREFSRLGVKTSLFDREEVLAVAREFLGREADDITLIGGDLTASLPSGTFDLVYFGNVLHIYSPETNACVAREAFHITVPGGTIAIQDYVWGRSPGAAMFAVNMLRSTDDGGVWTEEQHRAWLSDAGFTGIEIVDLDTSGGQLVLARCPAGL
jgi:SAM-dependent methyltransferase